MGHNGGCKTQKNIREDKLKLAQKTAECEVKTNECVIKQNSIDSLTEKFQELVIEKEVIKIELDEEQDNN